MSKQQVTVPDIGGAEGAEVIEVLVAVGDEVVVDQGLIVLESDKASMEIPSTVAGTVVELLVAEGQQLAEGAPIVVVDVAAGSEPAGSLGADNLLSVERCSRDRSRRGRNRLSADAPAAAAADQTVSVPDIGTDEAVELIEICVAVGDTVAEGDSLVVLESDKASMEVPSPLAGEVMELLVNTGDSVTQGDKLLILKGAADAAPASAPEHAADSCNPCGNSSNRAKYSGSTDTRGGASRSRGCRWRAQWCVCRPCCAQTCQGVWGGTGSGDPARARAGAC